MEQKSKANTDLLRGQPHRSRDQEEFSMESPARMSHLPPYPAASSPLRILWLRDLCSFHCPTPFVPACPAGPNTSGKVTLALGPVQAPYSELTRSSAPGPVSPTDIVALEDVAGVPGRTTFQCPEHTGAQHQVSRIGEQKEPRAWYPTDPGQTRCLRRSWSAHYGEEPRSALVDRNREWAGKARRGPSLSK